MNDEKPIQVINIVSPTKLVLNIGDEEELSNYTEFLIYSIGEEMFDPLTNESLGYLEIVKGKGKPVHIQKKMCTIESSIQKNEKRIIKKGGVWASMGHTEEITPSNQIQDFDNPQIGDYAKRIN